MNRFSGHYFLQGTLGVSPKHAWNVDTFGHSASTPELLLKMGYDSVSFAQLGEAEKERRKSSQELEFMWQGAFENDTSSPSILTHVMHEMYTAPCGLDVST